MNMSVRERVHKRYFLEVKHAIASSVAILDLGTKRASEERHKRESEHYIITTYISQKKEQLDIGCCVYTRFQ